MIQGPCIIWDWNGTILNDVDISHRIFNEMMADRGLSPVSFDYFRELYTHPIIDMYHQIGYPFTTEYTFDDLSLDWYRECEKALHEVQIFSDVESTLAKFHNDSAFQLVISALNHKILIEQVSQFSIQQYFAMVSGNDDMRADSKVERSVEVFSSLNRDLAHTWVIGDTLHDAAMAKAIGCRCALVSRGYEPKKKLESSSFPVFEDLSAAYQYITEQS